MEVVWLTFRRFLEYGRICAARKTVYLERLFFPPLIFIALLLWLKDVEGQGFIMIIFAQEDPQGQFDELFWLQ